jgi:hypothetical protein
VVAASTDEVACSVVVHGNEVGAFPRDIHTVGEIDGVGAHGGRIPEEWGPRLREVKPCETQGDGKERVVEGVASHKQDDDQAFDGLVVVFEQTGEDRVRHTFDVA